MAEYFIILFSHKAGIVFVHDNIFKYRTKNSATFKMELVAKIGNGRAYNQWKVVFVCCCGNSPSLKAKLKLDENEHGLKVASYMISCFVDMFLHFFEMSVTFCFTYVLFRFKNYLRKWKLVYIIVSSIFWGLINKSNHQHMFWKMLLIKCRKIVVKEFFKKK